MIDAHPPGASVSGVVPAFTPAEHAMHTLTAGQYEQAAGLNLTVRQVGPMSLTVLCPFCGGERRITAAALKNWSRKGEVPSCETVKKLNRGTDCRPVAAPTPASTEATGHAG